MRTGTGCHFPPGMSPLSSLVSTRITKVGHAATVTNGGTPQQSMVECSDATWCAPVCDPCLLPTGCLLVHTAQGREEGFRWRMARRGVPASCRGTPTAWWWWWSPAVGIPGPLGAPKETPSAGRGQPAPWRWDPTAASVAPSAACHPHQNLASMIPNVMVADRVQSKRGGWPEVLPTTGQERRLFLLIKACL